MSKLTSCSKPNVILVSFPKPASGGFGSETSPIISATNQPHHNCNHIPRPRPLKQLCPAERRDDGPRQPQLGLLPSPLLLHPCWRRSWSCWSSPERGHQQGHQQQLLQQHVTQQQQQHAAEAAAACQVAASNSSMLLALPPAPAH